MNKVKVAIFANQNHYYGEMLRDTVTSLIEASGKECEVALVKTIVGISREELQTFNIGFFAQDFGGKENVGIEVAQGCAIEYPNLLRITYSDSADLSKAHKESASDIQGSRMYLSELSYSSIRSLTNLALRHLDSLESNNDSQSELKDPS